MQPCPGITEHLAQVQAELERLTPHQALDRVRCGSLLVDTRPEFQRRAGGEVPGAIVIERNHLEWRLDPTSSARVPEAADYGVRWIILCDEGFSSSLAAASLRRLGLLHATDVIGGLQRWVSDGLLVTHPAVLIGPRLAAGADRPGD